MTTGDADKPPTNLQAILSRKVSTLPLWIAAVAIAGLGIAMVAPAEKMVFYNASVSVPRGWYVRVPLHEVSPGRLVLVMLPEAVAALAAERRYLPRGVPALKRIAAIPGDHVCERDGLVWINGQLAAVALRRDLAGRRLRAWIGCRDLQSDEVFLLNTLQLGSFDSRYFGPILRPAILGRAIPIWTEESD